MVEVFKTNIRHYYQSQLLMKKLVREIAFNFFN
jgi:hypothetical protein